MSLLPLLAQPDGTPLLDPILGMGGSGVVVQRDGYALKLPWKHCITGPCGAYAKQDETEALEILEHEKGVYRRLGKHQGIVDCFDTAGVGIQLALMEGGNLWDHLTKNQPSSSVLIGWLRDMARTLVYIHDQRVIVADIATRNFLLDAHQTIKISDFSEASILPLTADMHTADDSGYSMYTDIGQLGAVIYEVVTGKRCEFDLYKHQPSGPATAVWPRREDLPSTESVWLGSIIETCWTRGAFRSSRELATALDCAALD